MNRLRQFCATIVLTLAFAFTVLAGDMATGVVQSPPPPPPQAVSVIENIDYGVPTTNETTVETSFVDPMTEFTLNILRSFLSLF